jgi:hypothetical protein
VLHAPCPTSPFPNFPICPAAAAKKPAKKPAAGGLFGGLFGGKKKEGERVEEPAGGGTPGSPRMVQVPRPAVVAQPAGGAGGGAGTPTGMAPAPASAEPATTRVTTTTTTMTVPLSTQAAPIHAST